MTTRTWYRRMVARSPDERHRASTSLELLFDLCFVVAVAQAGARLHHDLTEGHLGHAVLGYLTVFFAIWWAWMNFTWFASAYDTDDAVYRLTTLVQITGALILAAGIPRAFDSADFTIVTLGYVVMRLAMVAQWLRAAHGDPSHRPAALRYAAGVTIVQIGWIARLALPEGYRMPSFFVLALAELAVPLIAERPGMTTWHPRHITERYGLFTIIVLGETVLAATFALQAALDAGGTGPELLALAGSGLVIVFSMWWLYFDRPPHELLGTPRMSFQWGYGHYLIFASAAAVGAGLAVGVDRETHVAHLSARAAGFSIALPVAVYLLVVWLLHVLPRGRDLSYAGAAVLILLTPFTPVAVHLTAVVCALLVAITVWRSSLSA